jgi:hypothetical protein
MAQIIADCISSSSSQFVLAHGSRLPTTRPSRLAAARPGRPGRSAAPDGGAVPGSAWPGSTLDGPGDDLSSPARSAAPGGGAASHPSAATGGELPPLATAWQVRVKLLRSASAARRRPEIWFVQSCPHELLRPLHADRVQAFTVKADSIIFGFFYY